MFVLLIPSSRAFGCGNTTWVDSDCFSTTIPRWRLTMSFSLTVDILSISGRRYIAGWTMTRFCSNVLWICMNISTLRSIREGDWKSNRRLQKITSTGIIHCHLFDKISSTKTYENHAWNRDVTSLGKIHVKNSDKSFKPLAYKNNIGW